MNTDVVIVGGGPVGITLALELASRNVKSVVIETREAGVVPTVKCNHISARTMEIFRRLGIADTIRANGLPQDFPHDVSIRTRVTGHELSRIYIPCSRDRNTSTNGPDTGWPTPEKPHRMNQIYMEPILQAHAAKSDDIELLFEHEFIGYEQDDSSVIAQIQKNGSTQQIQINGRYLVGCDGGKSSVRKRIGAQYVGEDMVQRVQSSYISAPKLVEQMQCDPAWCIINLNHERNGTLYAINGTDEWLIHNYLRPDEEGFESIDRDKCLRAILGVDESFEYELLRKEDWISRRLVADKFRDRNVFICGDASHLWTPYGGYGMNAGVADANNLGWKLAASVNGWGSSALLDTYQTERQPITEQVSHFVTNHAHKMISNRRAVPDGIEDNSPEGERIRREYGQEMYDLNVAQYACGGMNFGYFYTDSPIVIGDGEEAPAYTMQDFTLSTVPGCRLPCFNVDDKPLYDLLGSEYTLIAFADESTTQSIAQAADELGVPLEILSLDPSLRPSEFTKTYTLSRPDRHVAWRGDGLPSAPQELLKSISEC